MKRLRVYVFDSLLCCYVSSGLGRPRQGSCALTPSSTVSRISESLPGPAPACQPFPPAFTPLTLEHQCRHQLCSKSQWGKFHHQPHSEQYIHNSLVTIGFGRFKRTRLPGAGGLCWNRFGSPCCHRTSRETGTRTPRRLPGFTPLSWNHSGF